MSPRLMTVLSAPARAFLRGYRVPVRSFRYAG